MTKKKLNVKTKQATLILEALVQADVAHSEAIEGWTGLAYLQFKDHIDRYRFRKNEYSDMLRRQDRRVKTE